MNLIIKTKNDQITGQKILFFRNFITNINIDICCIIINY